MFYNFERCFFIARRKDSQQFALQPAVSVESVCFLSAITYYVTTVVDFCLSDR